VLPAATHFKPKEMHATLSRRHVRIKKGPNRCQFSLKIFIKWSAS
jgi:hypothetical protein